MSIGDRLTIVGTGVAIIAALALSSHLIVGRIDSVNQRITDLRSDVVTSQSEIRDEIEQLDDRIRLIEQRLGMIGTGP